jgi:hypothetical protein
MNNYLQKIESSITNISSIIKSSKLSVGILIICSLWLLLEFASVFLLGAGIFEYYQMPSVVDEISVGISLVSVLSIGLCLL